MATAWLIWPAAFAWLSVPARAELLTVDLHASGAVIVNIEMAHDLDAAHFCAASADPWGPDHRVDPRPPPYPFYRVVFGQAGPAAALERPGPSLSISLSHWEPPGGQGWVEDHEDQGRDRFDLVVDGRHFTGGPGLEPPPRLQFAYRDDGKGGAFLATGLHEEEGEGRLDVEGTWSCPEIDLSLTEVTVAQHPLFKGSIPATAAPPRLRLSLHRDGRKWRATGEDGRAFPTEVDLRALRLAPNLLAWAEAGQVVLLVEAEVTGGRRARVVAQRLDGVMPAPR